MIASILSKLIKVVLVSILGGSLSPAIPTPNFGAVYPVSNIATSRIAGGGISSTASSMTLRSLKFSVSNQDIQMSDFGTIGYATIEPGSSNKKETISFTGISQNASNDQATLSGIARGLSGGYPYTASTTLASSHSGGSIVIFSNPAIFYGENFANKNNTESIYGDWTFQATSTPQYRTTPTFTSGSNEFATVKLVEDTTNQGAATSTIIQGGISELATRSEAGGANETGGTGYNLVLPASMATTTRTIATSSVMMSDVLGYISQTFFNFNTLWAFGSTTHSASSTFAGDVEFRDSGTTTFSGGIELDGSSQGDIFYRDKTEAGWVILPAGTSGEVLQTGGVATNPSWLDTASLVEDNLVASTTITGMVFGTSTPIGIWASTTRSSDLGIYPRDRLIDGITNIGLGMDSTNDFIEIAFDVITVVKRWRQFGSTNNNGDGSFKLQYWSLSTGDWVDWVTITTKTTSSWSAYSEEIPIATTKMRLKSNVVDTGAIGSAIHELQLRYRDE